MEVELSEIEKQRQVKTLTDEDPTFSTTVVSLKVKYSPVVSDEKRLPYSLFKKNRYQTGVGNKAR